jgi:hypothetical protein
VDAPVLAIVEVAADPTPVTLAAKEGSTVLALGKVHLKLVAGLVEQGALSVAEDAFVVTVALSRVDHSFVASWAPHVKLLATSTAIMAAQLLGEVATLLALEVGWAAFLSTGITRVSLGLGARFKVADGKVGLKLQVVGRGRGGLGVGHNIGIEFNLHSNRLGGSSGALKRTILLLRGAELRVREVVIGGVMLGISEVRVVVGVVSKLDNSVVVIGGRGGKEGLEEVEHG